MNDGSCNMNLLSLSAWLSVSLSPSVSLPGHWQYPWGWCVLLGSGSSQYSPQDSSGWHPPVWNQTVVPGGRASSMQRPHVSPHLRHQPAQTTAETARWDPHSWFTQAHMLFRLEFNCNLTCVHCCRDWTCLCDGGKSGVRKEDCSGQWQRSGTDWRQWPGERHTLFLSTTLSFLALIQLYLIYYHKYQASQFQFVTSCVLVPVSVRSAAVESSDNTRPHPLHPAQLPGNIALLQPPTAHINTPSVLLTQTEYCIKFTLKVYKSRIF